MTEPGKPRRRARPERPGRPACPGWIDPEAKEVWRRTVALMQEMGILTRADANILARYCQTYARWVRAEQFIQQRGEIYPVKSGNGVVKCFFNFPAVGTAQKLSALLTKMERELGLTPAARAGLAEVTENFDNPERQEADRRFRESIGM